MGEGSETIEALPKTTSCKGQCQSETVQLGFLGNGEPKNYIFFVCLFSTSVSLFTGLLVGSLYFGGFYLWGPEGGGVGAASLLNFCFSKK